MPRTPKPIPSSSSDIIWGIDGEHGIAAAIGLTPKQVYYLVSQGSLPVRRHGHKTYSASRSQLLRYLAGELPPPSPEEAA